MSIKSRMFKINAVANNSRTRQTSSGNTTRKGIKGILKRWIVYSVGTDKPHHIEVFWHYENGQKVGSVQMFTHDPADMNDTWGMHKANDSRHTLCYQMLGALKFAAKEAGKSISFCDQEWKAKKLLNFGGEIVILRVNGGGTVWAVVRNIEKFSGILSEPFKADMYTYEQEPEEPEFGHRELSIEPPGIVGAKAGRKLRERLLNDRVDMMRGKKDEKYID